MADQPSGNNPWVNVAPAGELALAIAVISIGALMLGKVDGSATLIIGIWIASGSIVHFVVGFGCMAKGQNVNANAFVLFAAFLMLAAGIEFIVRFFGMINGWGPIDHTINGYLWIPIWFAVWFFTPSVLKEAPLVFIFAVLCLDIAFPLTSLMHLGVLGKGFATVAGYALWGAGALTTYMAGATCVNNSYGRTVLPMGAPIIKKKQ